MSIPSLQSEDPESPACPRGRFAAWSSGFGGVPTEARVAPPKGQTADETNRFLAAHRMRGPGTAGSTPAPHAIARAARAACAAAMPYLLCGRMPAAARRGGGDRAGPVGTGEGRHRLSPGRRAFTGARPTADTGSDDHRRAISFRHAMPRTGPSADGGGCGAAVSAGAPLPVFPAAGSASFFTAFQPPPPRRDSAQTGGAPEFRT
jgi:hypothetical protein